MAESVSLKALKQSKFQLEQEHVRLTDERTELEAEVALASAEIVVYNSNIANVDAALLALDPGSDPATDASAASLTAEKTELTNSRTASQLKQTTAQTRISDIDTLITTLLTDLADVNSAISDGNPSPTLSDILPDSISVGSSAVTLSAIGYDFIASSVIRVNGTDVTTTFVSSSELTAVLSASLFDTADVLSVTVFTGDPCGGESDPLPIAVTFPQATIWSVSPATITKSTESVSLSIFGTDFYDTSAVMIGDTVYSATLEAGKLTVVLPSNVVADPTTLRVRVVNPSPGGGTSETIHVPVLEPIISTMSIAQHPIDSNWFIYSFNSVFNVAMADTSLFSAIIYDSQIDHFTEYVQDSFSVEYTASPDGSNHVFVLTFIPQPSLTIRLEMVRTDRGFAFLAPVVTDDPLVNTRYGCASVQWPRMAITPFSADPNRFYAVNNLTTGFVFQRPQAAGAVTILQNIDNMGFIAFYEPDDQKILMIWHDDEDQNPLIFGGRGDDNNFVFGFEHISDRHKKVAQSWTRSYKVHIETFYGKSIDGSLCCYDAALRYREWAADPNRPWRSRGPWLDNPDYSSIANSTELQVTYSGSFLISDQDQFTNVIPRWLTKVAPFDNPLVTIYGWKNWASLTYGSPDYAQAGTTHPLAVSSIETLKAAGFNPILYSFLPFWDEASARTGWRTANYAQANNPAIPSDLESYLIRTHTGSILEKVEEYDAVVGTNTVETADAPYYSVFRFPDFSDPIWVDVYEDLAHRWCQGLGATAYPAGIYYDDLGTHSTIPLLLNTGTEDIDCNNDPTKPDWSQSDFNKGYLAAFAAFSQKLADFVPGAVTLTEWPSQRWVPYYDFVYDKSELSYAGTWVNMFSVVHGDAVRMTTYGTQITGDNNILGIAVTGIYNAAVVLIWLRGGVVALNDATESFADGNPTDPELIHDVLDESPQYYLLTMTQKLQSMAAFGRPYFGGHLTRPKLIDWRVPLIKEQPYEPVNSVGFDYLGNPIISFVGVVTSIADIAGPEVTNLSVVLDKTGGTFGSNPPWSLVVIYNKASQIYVTLDSSLIPEGSLISNDGAIGTYPAGVYEWQPNLFGGIWHRGIVGKINSAIDTNIPTIYDGDLAIDVLGGCAGSNPANSVVIIEDKTAVGTARYNPSYSSPTDQQLITSLGITIAKPFGDGASRFRYNSDLGYWVACSHNGWLDASSLDSTRFVLMSETWQKADGSLGIFVVHTFPGASDRRAADAFVFEAYETAYSEFFADKTVTITLDTERDSLPVGEKIIYRRTNGGSRVEIDRFVDSWVGSFTFNQFTVSLIEVVLA